MGFWEQLSFQSAIYELSNGRICIELRCGIWFTNKVCDLLEKPLKTSTSEFTLSALHDVNITGRFLSGNNAVVEPSDLVPHINEFFSCFLLSQLEMRFPLIFSKIARDRINKQAQDFGPICYNLNNTPSLFPHILKVISSDLTATTIFQLLLGEYLSHDYRIIDDR